jgi:hypothetical protein
MLRVLRDLRVEKFRGLKPRCGVFFPERVSEKGRTAIPQNPRGLRKFHGPQKAKKAQKNL